MGLGEQNNELFGVCSSSRVGNVNLDTFLYNLIGRPVIK